VSRTETAIGDQEQSGLKLAEQTQPDSAPSVPTTSSA